MTKELPSVRLIARMFNYSVKPSAASMTESLHALAWANIRGDLPMVKQLLGEFSPEHRTRLTAALLRHAPPSKFTVKRQIQVTSDDKQRVASWLKDYVPQFIRGCETFSPRVGKLAEYITLSESLCITIPPTVLSVPTQAPTAAAIVKEEANKLKEERPKIKKRSSTKQKGSSKIEHKKSPKKK